jgi:hypothetical protein
MKPIYIVAMIFLGASMTALSASNNNNNGKLQAETVRKATLSIKQAPATPPVVNKKVNFSGSVVQGVRSGNILQMVNPFAPASYGYGELNVTRDTVTGDPSTHQVTGLKLFALDF